MKRILFYLFLAVSQYALAQESCTTIRVAGSRTEKMTIGVTKQAQVDKYLAKNAGISAPPYTIVGGKFSFFDQDWDILATAFDAKGVLSYAMLATHDNYNGGALQIVNDIIQAYPENVFAGTEKEEYEKDASGLMCRFISEQYIWEVYYRYLIELSDDYAILVVYDKALSGKTEGATSVDKIFAEVFPGEDKYICYYQEDEMPHGNETESEEVEEEPIPVATPPIVEAEEEEEPVEVAQENTTSSQSTAKTSTPYKIHEGYYTYTGIFYVDGNINTSASGTPVYMTLYDDYLLIQESNGTSRTLKRIYDSSGPYAYKNDDSYKYVFDYDFNLNTYDSFTASFLGVTMTSVMKNVYAKGKIESANSGYSGGYTGNYSGGYSGGYNNTTTAKQTCTTCSGSGRCSTTTIYNKYYCHGSGVCQDCFGKGYVTNAYTTNKIVCTSCNGTGRCHYCNGTGRCQACNGTGVR